MIGDEIEYLGQLFKGRQAQRKLIKRGMKNLFHKLCLLTMRISKALY